MMDGYIDGEQRMAGLAADGTAHHPENRTDLVTLGHVGIASSCHSEKSQELDQ
jgi:hypothetical protein